MKRTKIIATINGGTCTEELLRRLHAEGMDAVRLNTAHTTLEEMAKTVALVRKVSGRLAIMVDTKGPNIRTVNVETPRELKTGDRIRVSGNPLDPPGVQVNYAGFVNEIAVGRRIVFDDGDMEVKVVERRNGILECEALRDGTIRNHKSVNVPGAELKVPALSRRDREFIDYSIAHDIDFIAHSFVRGAPDVLAVKSILETADSKIKVIAKIENRQGVDNLDAILEVADGLMVARGDLGIEIPLEEVPIIQKDIIHACMKRGKPVITATQMLQSMENSPRPTRAEVSDVANAVFDGTDAVMLSGETALGRYPAEAVAMMSRIVRETENSPRNFFTKINEIMAEVNRSSHYMIRTAVKAADSLPVKAIICNTSSGNSARLCASYRGRVPIYAFSYKPLTVRQLALSYGVFADHSEYNENLLELSRCAVRTLHQAGKLQAGDMFVVTSRQLHEIPYNNLCYISIVDDILRD